MYRSIVSVETVPAFALYPLFRNEDAKEGYDGEIDVFAVYSPAVEQSYAVPIHNAPNTSMGLRVEPASKQSPNINWADDFLLTDWIEDTQSIQTSDHD
ncbi:hypothetical protein G3I44_17775 [Halogeometricum borinquense]|uniref:PD(D/E)XK endonuclease domain-containing protein n=1 Tax=Halogeometricum borinquense TaxID=60847 RepID=A0A6C0UKJ8_9EURY|nr:hypothetical protein G3I44_17775 [Halogeometricum borinquense]